MSKEKLLKILYWVLFIGAVIFLYFSLRTQYYQLEYSLVALGLWGGAFLLNRFVKKEDTSE
ncbi:hypothetical protein SAMN04488029_3891 [Reichenbachiella faecimaris]|uniref:Uncharacterized protein n=1 Tax=Reichenbachiella faecimaris TaxID=692418 RepID=A0A1W2GRD5_REIFA|nr:hypothetical protein [Reichenbachiella faecimaris]SMD38816.1 hypothetical protein SAMN04488029_3891 [Reichenbachiella faecimaris]